MKRNNPNIPILIREAAGTQPKVFARYGWYPGISAAPCSTYPEIALILTCHVQSEALRSHRSWKVFPTRRSRTPLLAWFSLPNRRLLPCICERELNGEGLEVGLHNNEMYIKGQNQHVTRVLHHHQAIRPSVSRPSSIRASCIAMHVAF